MDDILYNLKKENSETIDETAGKITLIIVDRSFDALSPILHDFFY